MRPAQAKQKLYIERKEWNAKGYNKKKTAGHAETYINIWRLNRVKGNDLYISSKMIPR